MNKKTNRLLVMVICVLALLICAGCGQVAETNGTTHAASETADNTEETADTAVTESQPDNETAGLEDTLETTSVATPYGTLYYPANWEELFSTRVTRGENYVVEFLGMVDDVELTLFCVSFGNGSAEGHLFGTVPGPDGEMAEIRVNVVEFQPEDHWSEEMTNTFYSMQEEVNSVIAQIYDLPGFVSAN